MHPTWSSFPSLDKDPWLLSVKTGFLLNTETFKCLGSTIGINFYIRCLLIPKKKNCFIHDRFHHWTTAEVGSYAACGKWLLTFPVENFSFIETTELGPWRWFCFHGDKTQLMLMVTYWPCLDVAKCLDVAEGNQLTCTCNVCLQNQVEWVGENLEQFWNCCELPFFSFFPGGIMDYYQKACFVTAWEIALLLTGAFQVYVNLMCNKRVVMWQWRRKLSADSNQQMVYEISSLKSPLSQWYFHWIILFQVMYLVVPCSDSFRAFIIWPPCLFCLAPFSSSKHSNQTRSYSNSIFILFYRCGGCHCILS